MTNDNEKIANGECISSKGVDHCPKCIDTCDAHHFRIELKSLMQNKKFENLVAEFMGYTVTPITDLSGYYLKYDKLMPVWYKFRDLKFNDDLLFYKHEEIADTISRSITYSTITKAFDELVKGIIWYNSINK